MAGPNIEDTLAWMIENRARSPQAEVVVSTATGSETYTLKTWRDGTIAMRPKRHA